MNAHRVRHAAVLGFLLTLNIVIFSLAHNLSRPATVAPLPTVAVRVQSAAPVGGSIAESVAAAQPNESSIVQIVPGSSTTTTAASVPAQPQTASASSPQTAPSVAQVNPITNGAQSSVVTTIYGQPNQASAAPDVQTAARDDANAQAAAAVQGDQLGGASLMGASRPVTVNFPLLMQEETPAPPIAPDIISPVNGYIVRIISPSAANLPAEVAAAIGKAIDGWAQPLPRNNTFFLTHIRLEATWGVASMTSADLEAPLPFGEETHLSFDNTFSLLVTQTDNGWDGAVDSDTRVQELLAFVPESELNQAARQTAFASQTSLQSSLQAQQYNGYTLPFPPGRAWNRTRGGLGWHGGSYGGFFPSNNSLDFAPMDGLNSDIIASAPGMIIDVCTDGFGQGALVINTENTTERLGYLHIRASDIFSLGWNFGDTVEHGTILGKMVEGFVGSIYACGLSEGTHIHMFLPTRPFTMCDYTFSDSNTYGGEALYSCAANLNPGVPTVLEPSDGATVGNAFNLVLQPGELNQTQAFDFRVEVTTPDDTEFANPIFEQGSITDTTIPLNLPNGTWKLRVQQGDTVDRSSEWVTITLDVSDPVLICPGGVPQIDLAIHDALLTRQYNRSYTQPFWVGSNASGGVLLVQSKVGAPEAGCPAIAGPLCQPDQPGESFHVALDGRRAATIPDHGHNRWQTFSFMLPLNRGTHTLRADHANLPSSPDRFDSVSFNASYCINGAPTAVNDSGVTPFGEPITVDVLANDSDPENHTLTILSVSDPAHGTAAIADGKVVYTPDPGFSGTEVFSYTLQDIVGATASASVTITVEPYQDPPLVCEPNYTQVDIATTAFVLTGQSGMNTRSFTFTLPTDSRSGLLLVAATVGHPEAGCPAASNSPLCQPQDNESATLTIDDISIGIVPDFGDHGVQQFSFAQGLPAGEHVFVATHILPPGDDPYNSISLRAIYCVEQEIVIEDPIELTQEAVSIESDLLATPEGTVEATSEPQPVVEQPPVELTVEAAPVESVPVEVPSQEALPPAPEAPAVPETSETAPPVEGTAEAGG